MLAAVQNITVTETSHSYVNYPAFAVLFAFFLAGPVVGYLIGRRKGHPVLGTVLGLLLHVLGWIVMAVIPRTATAEARHEQHAAEKVAHARAA